MGVFGFILGMYGLIRIEPSESNKTLVQPISQESIMRISRTEQCLRYYYYFTFYDEFNWGQRILISIKNENDTDDNTTEIDRVSINDIKGNGWNFRNITFESTSNNYSVLFIFTLKNRILSFFSWF